MDSNEFCCYNNCSILLSKWLIDYLLKNECDNYENQTPSYTNSKLIEGIHLLSFKIIGELDEPSKIDIEFKLILIHFLVRIKYGMLCFSQEVPDIFVANSVCPLSDKFRNGHLTILEQALELFPHICHSLNISDDCSFLFIKELKLHALLGCLRAGDDELIESVYERLFECRRPCSAILSIFATEILSYDYKSFLHYFTTIFKPSFSKLDEPFLMKVCQKFSRNSKFTCLESGDGRFIPESPIDVESIHYSVESSFCKYTKKLLNLEKLERTCFDNLAHSILSPKLHKIKIKIGKFDSIKLKNIWKLLDEFDLNFVQRVENDCDITSSTLHARIKSNNNDVEEADTLQETKTINSDAAHAICYTLYESIQSDICDKNEKTHLQNIQTSNNDVICVNSVEEHTSSRETHEDKKLFDKNYYRVWSISDEKKLVGAVRNYGIGNWSKIIKKNIFDKNYTSSQLKNKWNYLKHTRQIDFDESQSVLNNLDTSSVKYGRTKWTFFNEEKLKKAVNEIGVGKWTQIKTEFNFDDYSTTQLKDKWRNLKKYAQGA